MPRARKHLVCLDTTPYYHVVSRCVRRAFLCGEDRVTGKSFEHRRGWIEDRVRLLSSIFCVDVAAYAIMSNHYHLVVKLVPDRAANWSDHEVLERWAALYRGPLLMQRHREGETLSAAEHDSLASIARVFRKRLMSLSWFMKCLNEPIARQANREDGCTGHFWEARFHSQALTSDRAVLAAMAYVDLNPVRAGIAETPENSEFTSFRARLDEEAIGVRRRHRHTRPLLPFADVGGPDSLPVRQQEYLALVDVAGRTAQHGKARRISARLKPILARLGLSQKEWVTSATQFRQTFRRGDLIAAKSA